VARIIKVNRIGPYRIESAEFPLFICGCGLSRSLPFCDGAHKYCWQEEPGEVYTYDDQRRANEMREESVPKTLEIE
jgi:CDGSH-type Zn-finger protein